MGDYMTVNVCSVGACGRMCGLVTKTIIENEKKLNLVAAVDSPDSKKKGKDIGKILGTKKTGILVEGSDKLNTILKEKKVDVIIDFTTPKASLKNVKKAAENNVNVVVGTTGFSDEQKEEMKKIIRENNISGVIYPNMAVGVNILFKLVKNASKMLSDYDIEIIEAHHNEKRDSPSGTAGKIGEIISDVTGKEIKYGRGKEKQKRGNEIRIHAIRGGDISGDHTVMFAGPGERIELTHKASSRKPFASGTIKAVEFISDKKDGKVHDMGDVLGL